MSWTQGFFDVAYTEAWAAFGAFDRTEEEVDALVDLLGLDAPADILDVPCGFGRHAGALAARGHRVTGVDASSDQLRLARERNPGPTYVQGDMADPPDGPFDVVVNLFTSLGYDDDAADGAALRAWRDRLRPGGRLVLETMHRDRVARIWQPGPRRMGPVTEDAEIDWAAGVVRSTWTMPDATERTMQVRLYCATELIGMVREAGFADVAAYGSLRRDPLSPETRLVLLAS